MEVKISVIYLTLFNLELMTSGPTDKNVEQCPFEYTEEVTTIMFVERPINYDSCTILEWE